MISSAYSEANSDDLLFIEVDSKKLIDEFKEEARVGFEIYYHEQTELLRKCQEDGVFDCLKRLDQEDMDRNERKELEDKQ